MGVDGGFIAKKAGRGIRGKEGAALRACRFNSYIAGHVGELLRATGTYPVWQGTRNTPTV